MIANQHSRKVQVPPGLRSWVILSRPCGTGLGGNVHPGLTPDFLYAALDKSAYAAFFTESRMRLIGPTKLDGNPVRPGLLSAVPPGLDLERNSFAER
jgi:hypothetical protein